MSASKEQMALFKGVYGIVDEDAGRDMEEVLDAYLTGGASVVQVRMKSAPTRTFIEWARSARQKCAQAGVLCIVNDRADIAALIEADGVHLGQGDAPVAAARALMPHGIIGRSTHNDRQIWLASAEGADYVGFGPVFKPKSKRDHEPLVGIKGLVAAVKTAPLPVVAIGGIALDNIKQVVGTGVQAAATIGCVAQAWQPKDAVRSLVRAFTVAATAPRTSIG